MKFTERKIVDSLKTVFGWTCMDVCKYYGLGDEEFKSMANSNDFNVFIEVNKQLKPK